MLSDISTIYYSKSNKMREKIDFELKYVEIFKIYFL